VVGILDALAEHIKQKTDVDVLIEPIVVVPQKPHLRLSLAGWQFDSIKQTDTYEAKEYTAMLFVSGKFMGEGDGPNVFLDDVLKYSFALHFLFAEPFSIPFIQNDKLSGKTAGAFSVSLQNSPKGEFLPNSQEGKKPFIFYENYELALFFAYSKSS
jgi:hypothetical protein